MISVGDVVKLRGHQRDMTCIEDDVQDRPGHIVVAWLDDVGQLQTLQADAAAFISTERAGAISLKELANLIRTGEKVPVPEGDALAWMQPPESIITKVEGILERAPMPANPSTMCAVPGCEWGTSADVPAGWRCDEHDGPQEKPVPLAEGQLPQGVVGQCSGCKRNRMLYNGSTLCRECGVKAKPPVAKPEGTYPCRHCGRTGGVGPGILQVPEAERCPGRKFAGDRCHVCQKQLITEFSCGEVKSAVTASEQKPICVGCKADVESMS